MIPSVPQAPIATTQPRNDRLIALCLLGLVAFSPPLLQVFGVGTTVFGLPLLLVYIFAVWGALVLAIAIDVELRGDGQAKGERFSDN